MNYPYYQPYPINNGIKWIQGIEGAKAFPLTPNSNAILMDSESEKFYIKTCDSAGMCNLRTFKYTEEVAKKNDYVTKEEFDAFLERLKNEHLISRNEQSATESATEQSTVI